MPNWTFLIVGFVYDLGLALWIGGAVALGALAAPELFSRIEPKRRAGEIFGPILRRFRRLRIVAIVAVVAAAAIRFTLWERVPSAGPGLIWIMIRWLLIIWLAGTVFYEMLYLEGAIERARDERSPEEDVSAAFRRLHAQSERLMKLSVLVAAAALFLS